MIHDGNDLDLTEYEDMRSQHKRYRSRSGTQDACRLPSERDMPKNDAIPEVWEAFHQAKRGQGGWDPCSLIR